MPEAPKGRPTKFPQYCYRKDAEWPELVSEPALAYLLSIVQDLQGRVSKLEEGKWVKA